MNKKFKILDNILDVTYTTYSVFHKTCNIFLLNNL